MSLGENLGSSGETGRLAFRRERFHQHFLHISSGIRCHTYSRPSTPALLGSSPSWSWSSIRNQELGSALAAGLWGAAGPPEDSPIKSYSLHRETIIQAEGARLRLRNTDEERNAGKQILKETVGGGAPEQPRRPPNL